MGEGADNGWRRWTLNREDDGYCEWELWEDNIPVGGGGMPCDDEAYSDLVEELERWRLGE